MSNTEQASAASCPADTPGADPPTSTPGDPPRYVDRRRSWLTEDVPDVDDDDSIDDAIMLPILPLELAVVCCMTNFLLPGVGLYAFFRCALFISTTYGMRRCWLKVGVG